MQSDQASVNPQAPACAAAGREYRDALARSLDAARRHDQFSARLHAIESAWSLIRLLFALEGRPAPDVEHLAVELSDIEAKQDWPAGYLPWILLDLLRDPTPRRQLELARRVNRLLAFRGLAHVIEAATHTPEVARAAADHRSPGRAGTLR